MVCGLRVSRLLRESSQLTGKTKVQAPQSIRPECCTELKVVGAAGRRFRKIFGLVVAGVRIANVPVTFSLAIGARFSATNPSCDA